MPNTPPVRRRPLAIALALMLVATLPATSLHAQEPPQQTRKTYTIAAGPLEDALTRFAAIAGIALSFDPALVAGLRSPGLSGSHTGAEGLRRLLQGSGLEPVERSDGGYTLRKLPPAPAGETTLAPVTVRASGLNDATTEGTGSYAVKAATLFKGTQSLKEIPQSVTVITRQKIDDQRLDTLHKVLENTPGITLVERPGGGADVYSRGFRSNTIQYDGVPLARESYWGNSFTGSSVHLDRVEVLRGAQGLLEGAGNPAGAINVVRKRGLADTAVKAEVRAGSWDNYGTRLDIGGALNANKTLRARAVLDYEDKASFIDTLADRNLNAYLALDFDLTPDTTLGLGLVHSLLKGNSSTYSGIPRYADGRKLGISRSTFVGADWNDAERRETQILVDLEHRFNPDWKLKVSGLHVQEDWESIQSTGQGLVAAGSTLVPFAVGYDYDYSARNAGFGASLSGKFTALGMQHEILVGGNYSSQKRNDGYLQYWNHTTYGNVFAVDHDVPRLGTTAPTDIADIRSDTYQKGLYSMLRSHLTDDLTLILGARSNWYEYKYNGTTTKKETGELTPYAGLVYALTPQWSVYASYADIFQPQTATNARRQVLDPILGINYEVGIKGELFDGALNASLAIFRIDQKNRAVNDTSAPRICGSAGTGWCSRPAGKIRSEGVELEAHGNLSRGWQISGGYTYNRNEFLKDSVASNIGKPFQYNTPKHMLRLWSDYQLPGQLEQWRIGAGVNYRSKQMFSNTAMKNPIQGGYSVWNARVAYQIDKNWSASLNIDNVFDKHYFSHIEDGWAWFNAVGTPRNYMLTLRGRF